MDNTLQYLVESVDLRNHPRTNSKEKNKGNYYLALSYIVQKTITDSKVEISAEAKEYISKRLELYCEKLRPDAKTVNSEDESIKALSACVRWPWRAKQRLWLMCDLALILLDKSLVQVAATTIKQFLPHKSHADIDTLVGGFLNDSPIYSRYPQAESQIKQYLNNQIFFSNPEVRIIVTANMSAGKSTLINALIGKPVARTSQEVCTGSVCYLYNKAFEDSNIHLSTNTLSLHATEQELRNYQWSGAISMASFFARLVPTSSRICLIDTPGVDAALYKDHTKQTHDALLRQNYDAAIYVVSPTNLGTDAEKKHLLWVAKNIPHDKVIFVLNKLDDYRSCSDSIEESIQGLREDLSIVGFENPTICPISAYFSYLLKLKVTGQTMSDDEADEYAFFVKKFKRASYDLSRFYTDCTITDSDTEEMALSKRSGLYGLEKIIYKD